MVESRRDGHRFCEQKKFFVFKNDKINGLQSYNDCSLFEFSSWTNVLDRSDKIINNSYFENQQQNRTNYKIFKGHTNVSDKLLKNRPVFHRTIFSKELEKTIGFFTRQTIF